MTTARPTLLVVDDEAIVRHTVSRAGRDAGFEVISCPGPSDATRELARRSIDMAIVDLRMPGATGIDVLREIRQTAPSCEVILMSGFATVDSAVEAVKLGARDYLTKPIDFRRLSALLKDVRDEAERRQRLLTVERTVTHALEFHGMLGRSPVMQETFSMIRRLAPHVRTVLITGETGTGKELVARALHQAGPRRGRRFVAINCSAMVETLFESELFGHVRGAFTGATDHKPGFFEAADGGTLFLDEVAELPLTVQAKLLRTLEQGEVQRVGAVDTRKVDVCVFAATNRDVRTEIAAGRFRGDLYYRLNVVEITLPPLRDRREDIPYLTSAFVADCARRLKKPLIGVTPAVERMLASRPWEGNVRELRNTIERACLLSEGQYITERELADQAAPPKANGDPRRAEGAPPATLETLERDHIAEVLRSVGGNKQVAARALGVSRRSLYRKLARLGLFSSAPRNE